MTSVLTDEERSEIGWAHSASDRLFGEIEAAVIRKLTAGVSVEPLPAMKWQHNMYTLEQLTTERAAARVQENERCLALMDSIGCDWRDAGDMAKFYAANYLREAIRALLGKEQS